VPPRYVSKKLKITDDEGKIFLKNMDKFLLKYTEQCNIESNIFVYHISMTNFTAKARDERFEYGKNKVHILSAWCVCGLG
jgi:hypothetical protein